MLYFLALNHKRKTENNQVFSAANAMGPQYTRDSAKGHLESKFFGMWGEMNIPQIMVSRFVMALNNQCKTYVIENSL